MSRSIGVYWRHGKTVLREQGIRALLGLIFRRWQRITGRYHPGFYDFKYLHWRKRLPASHTETHLPVQPRFSIVVPIYNVDKRWLDATIDSVCSQSYEHWQLCLINDGSTQRHIKSTLDRHAESDSRIIVRHHSTNKGIAASSSLGLSISDGEYIIFLDHDDLLASDALWYLVSTINDHPDADLIYSDEDKVDAQGNYSQPFFKPDFSPELLLSQNYFGHLVAYRHNLIQTIDGFRNGYDGAQDYDLVLRATNAAKHIVHIPKVLYHWRQIPGSTAMVYGEKDYAWTAGQEALQNHLNDSHAGAEAKKGSLPGTYRIDYPLVNSPSVSVVVPFRDKPELLDRCLTALYEQTDWRSLEVIAIDNRSQEPAIDRIKQHWTSKGVGARFAEYEQAFNFSAICNFGVNMARGDYVVLLNNDVEIVSARWIESLLGLAQQEKVGAVGAILRYPDNRVQHAGIVTGIGGHAGHPFKGFDENQIGYFGRLEIDSNVSAVTGALMMVSKQKYLAVGGLDQDRFSVALNDVDFCLKLMKAGYRNVVTAKCQAIHHESASRGSDIDPSRRARYLEEVETFKQVWATELEQGDPYYNPNLTLDSEDYTLRW